MHITVEISDFKCKTIKSSAILFKSLKKKLTVVMDAIFRHLVAVQVKH